MWCSAVSEVKTYITHLDRTAGRQTADGRRGGNSNDNKKANHFGCRPEHALFLGRHTVSRPRRPKRPPPAQPERPAGTHAQQLLATCAPLPLLTRLLACLAAILSLSLSHFLSITTTTITAATATHTTRLLTLPVPCPYLCASQQQHILPVCLFWSVCLCFQKRKRKRVFLQIYT